MTDKAEEAYWRFDARRKGYAEWKETPQSERDAFKAEYPDLHAWALKHKATVEGMIHNKTCPKYRADYATSRSDWTDEPCNCPRGDALRGIEELLK